MKYRAGLTLLALLTFCLLAAAPPRKIKQISLEELRDKIAGGWAGQMIGVSFGAPTEFRYQGKIIEGDLPKWTPDRVKNAIEQDDLYVDMTFAKVLDDKGIDANTEDFGAMFKDARYRLWHANLAARRALKRGIPATLSGTPQYNAHANDIDFQIESDFIGLMTPGMPESAKKIAWRAGRVMNYGDGIYGGIFVSCMYSAAFFEQDPRRVVEAGLACLPVRSAYAQVVADALALHKEFPNDWKAAWAKINEKWDKNEPCPEGALKPFNIDAKLNGAYVVLGLLYGGGDFARTLEVATRAGQDSDCNPSTACGVLGTIKGYRWIPAEWKSGIASIADTKFDYTDFTFKTIVDSTARRAVSVAKNNGGRLDGENVIVKLQAFKPARLEQWSDYGKPAERIAASDPRWKWTGDWETSKQQRIASRNAEAQIEFAGTGAILVGPYLPDGGAAVVYLDGKLDREVDSYSDEADAKGGEALWHRFRLPTGTHKLRIVVRGKNVAGSAGSKISLQDLVVYQ